MLTVIVIVIACLCVTAHSSTMERPPLHLPLCDPRTGNTYTGETGDVQTCVSMESDDMASIYGQLPKGQNQPLGYHQDYWKGVDTMYEFPDPEVFYRDYIRKNRPLLVKGALRNSKAYENWSNVSYLREHFGHSGGEVMATTDRDPYHYTFVMMQMSEFLDTFEKKKYYYDSGTPLSMAKDMIWPHYLHCDKIIKYFSGSNVLFNSGWSSTEHHQDNTETLFAQMAGTRRWIITKPDTVADLYAEFNPYHSAMSPVNKEKMDLIKYPNASKVEVYNVTAEAGDIMYCPEGWFHQVRAYGSPSIAVSFFLKYLRCDNLEGGSVERSAKCQKRWDKYPKEIKCSNDRNKTVSMDFIMKKFEKLNPVFKEYNTNDIYEPLTPNPVALEKSEREVPGIGYAVTDTGNDTVRNIKYAFHCGIRLLEVSPDDGTEQALAKAVSETPTITTEDLFIVIKIHPKDLGYENTRNSIKKSLANMKIKYADLAILQAPSCQTKWFPCKSSKSDAAWKQSWKAMKEYKNKGLIKYLGVGHFSLEQLQEMVESTREPVSVVWNRMDPVKQNTQLREYCQEQGIVFMAHSVLGNQLVREGTLKYNPIFARDSRSMYYKAARMKASPAAIVLRWAVEKGAVPLFRSANLEHILFNWQASRIDFNDDDLLALDKMEGDPLSIKELVPENYLYTHRALNKHRYF